MTAPQMEDKPLLPMDNAVDRREWTLQHRKAADITLTPPQADLDMDLGLDVNVKGPGTVMNHGQLSAPYHVSTYPGMLLAFTDHRRKVSSYFKL